MIILRVREIAEERGWNAGRLGRAARISNAAMYGIWNGITTDPGVQTLGAIARAIGVPVCDLMEEDGTEVAVAPKPNEEGPEGEVPITASSLPAGPSSFFHRSALANI